MARERDVACAPVWARQSKMDATARAPAPIAIACFAGKSLQVPPRMRRASNKNVPLDENDHNDVAVSSSAEPPASGTRTRRPLDSLRSLGASPICTAAALHNTYSSTVASKQT